MPLEPRLGISEWTARCIRVAHYCVISGFHAINRFWIFEKYVFEQIHSQISWKICFSAWITSASASHWIICYPKRLSNVCGRGSNWRYLVLLYNPQGSSWIKTQLNTDATLCGMVYWSSTFDFLTFWGSIELAWYRKSMGKMVVSRKNNYHPRCYLHVAGASGMP